jgi:hypothetical protein
MRPGPDANERLGGCLGRAAEYYDVPIYGFGFLSTHYHILYGAEDGLQMSRFQCHLNSNIAREIGRLHGHREKFWNRRYRPVGISDERAAQRRSLKYVLGQGTKEGLVASPLEWPGLNAARALLYGEPVVGTWFNRTKEHYARSRGIDFGKYDFATRYEIELKQLPAYQDDSPEEYQAMIAEILWELEEEAAANWGGREVLGVERILAQDPCQPVGKAKRSPTPMLFLADRPETLRKMRDDYKDFEDEHRTGFLRLREAAERGYRLDPARYLPQGSVPPAVIESILKASRGFNPEAAFPPRCFPSPWPFVGGQLAPAPPPPPSRRLVIRKIGGKLKIVWRGEIPTVRVPRRAAAELQGDATIGLPLPTFSGVHEVQPAGRDPARDPP